MLKVGLKTRQMIETTSYLLEWNLIKGLLAHCFVFHAVCLGPVIAQPDLPPTSTMVQPTIAEYLILWFNQWIVTWTKKP